MSFLSEPNSNCATCDVPNSTLHLYWCSVCELLFCDLCWDKETPHRKGIQSGIRRARKPHEKTKWALADLILNILEPTLDEEVIRQQIEANADTKWFCVDEEITGEACFHDLGRFSQLSGNSDMSPADQFPCLVSFFGETGAGKSTLINALIKIHGGTNEVTPVMSQGSGADRSTSGDVHLFSDPNTYHKSSRPIYYADCEGLNGGSHLIPMGSMALELNRKNIGTPRQHLRVRVIKYYREMTEIKTRQWAIEKLFPRVLFTLSDVVCLVTQNFRYIEEHLERLLKWADNALAKSVNQPVLPFAIIVVNAMGSKEMKAKDWCDVDATTAEQLKLYKDIVNDTINGVPKPIPALAQKWRKRGRPIKTLQDLLNCYYSDFKVICIPTADHPAGKILQQYQTLYNSITDSSIRSRDSRGKVGLLLSSEDLHFYFDFAFEHFSIKENEPFNFNDAAFRINPVAKNFKDHIVRLAVYFMGNTSVNKLGDGKDLFCEDVAPLLASSIFLTATRKHIALRGSYKDISKHYKDLFLEAHTDFYEKHWLCEEIDKKGNRCVNVARSHKKGHQRSNGKSFGGGPFKASINDPVTKLILQNALLDKIDKKLCSLVEELKQNLKTLDGSPLEDKKAAEIHLNRTLAEYTCEKRWSRTRRGRTALRQDENKVVIEVPLVSYTTCFCCLSATPIHVLNCTHVICQSCLESFSEYDEKNLQRVLTVCPLCCNSNSLWKEPWTTPVKPPTAGLRILSLDGGGIRSIVQLKILEELEKMINIDMPIQEFFDLIIGTSGGGIVAYGLGMKRLSASNCIEEFKTLSRKAFTKRKGVTWRGGIGTLIEAKHHSIYKSRGLENALKKVFGEDPIFGKKSGPNPLKVGVSATSSNNHHPFLLANYNRTEPEHRMPYTFFRQDSSKLEMKAWEAVRASAAAPFFFKPFFHRRTGHTFRDGGIKYNNPVAIAEIERKLLWPSMSDQDPDILLSLGTGYNSGALKANPDDPGPRAAAGIGGFARRMMKLGFEIIRDSINCEKKWEDFLSTLAIESGDEDRSRKFARLNPDFKGTAGLPRLDEVEKMESLLATTQEFAIKDEKIEIVAASLVASLFYFEATPQAANIRGSQPLKGLYFFTRHYLDLLVDVSREHPV
ncbi:hypothetical protein EDC01DRAFT_609926 [Geopyxis carbonaria]|nr:hypothetical protein EDC01DRAFT_609926 [Geopyxis carbonaria]